MINRKAKYIITLGEFLEYGSEYVLVPERIKQLNITAALLPDFVNYYNKSMFKRLFTEQEDLCPSILDSINNYHKLIDSREQGIDFFNDLAESLLETDPVVAIDYRIPNSWVGEMKPFIKTSLDIDYLFDSIKTQVNMAYHENSAFKRNYEVQNKSWACRVENTELSLMSVIGEQK